MRLETNPHITAGHGAQWEGKCPKGGQAEDSAEPPNPTRTLSSITIAIGRGRRSDTNKGFVCCFHFCEPRWSLLSWFCGPCSPGVHDLSSSCVPSSSCSDGFLWLCLVFGCRALHLLPSIAAIYHSQGQETANLSEIRVVVSLSSPCFAVLLHTWCYGISRVFIL